MNHTYRVVWNSILSTWQAVAETARGKGKSKSVQSAAVAVAAALLMGGLAQAQTVALPTSGKSYTVKLWFDEQGTNPNLNLKFYLYHS